MIITTTDIPFFKKWDIYDAKYLDVVDLLRAEAEPKKEQLPAIQTLFMQIQLKSNCQNYKRIMFTIIISVESRLLFATIKPRQVFGLEMNFLQYFFSLYFIDMSRISCSNS